MEGAPTPTADDGAAVNPSTTAVPFEPHAMITAVPPQLEATPESENGPTAVPTAPAESTPLSSQTEAVTVAQWSTLEIVLPGPHLVGLNADANPFRILADVVFSAPDGREVVVPAFYDGDGAGGMDGNLWKTRFTPDVAGEWNFISTSAESQLDGQSGSFTVTAVGECPLYEPGGLPDFACMGRLEYVGESYLKLANGPYWLKGGADEPEDFLAPEQTVGFADKQEAIDYLAALSVNSLYMMLHNIGGDGRNVWPWYGENEREARLAHQFFDLAKLSHWEATFRYLQGKGIVLHLVFEDDSAWNDFDRSLYYREMVARFGHHNGIIWNLAEEYNELYAPDEIIQFARMLRDLDPYDHPITVHHAGPLDRWLPFVGVESIDMTSFQTQKEPRNDAAVAWARRVADAGRVIPISFDETGQFAPNERALARHVVWATYLGGANYEIFTRLSNAGYEPFTDFFADMSRARAFVESVPYWGMRPLNSLLSQGEGYLLAEPGEAYLFYLPQGGTITLDLTAVDGGFQTQWYDPRTGSYTDGGVLTGGSLQNLTAPFADDAAVRVTRIEE